MVNKAQKTDEEYLAMEEAHANDEDGIPPDAVVLTENGIRVWVRPDIDETSPVTSNHTPQPTTYWGLAYAPKGQPVPEGAVPLMAFGGKIVNSARMMFHVWDVVAYLSFYDLNYDEVCVYEFPHASPHAQS